MKSECPDRAWASAHLCRPGCSRWGSGRQALGSHSRLPQVMLHSSQEPHTSGPGQAGTAWHCRMPTTQVLEIKVGLQKTGTCLLPWRPSCPAGDPRLPGLLAHQLSHSPAITSLSSRLSQDLSPDPTEWLWFSRIPEGTGAGQALQMAQPSTNPAQSSTPLSAPTGTRVLVDGGHRSPNGQQSWDTGVAHSHLQFQAGPCGQSGRGQVGGHCCAWGAVVGDTDPCLWAGTGSGTGPVGAWGGAVHTKTILGQLALGSPTAGLLAACQVWLAHDLGETGPHRSGGRAAHREDPGYLHRLQQEGSRTGRFGTGSILRRGSRELSDQPSCHAHHLLGLSLAQFHGVSALRVLPQRKWHACVYAGAGEGQMQGVKAQR